MTRILILRFSSIGDIVLTTPVVRCLKKQLAGAEIHYLTKPGFKNILELNPYIDQLHVLDRPLVEKSMELKSLGFDYIIDLHSNLRTRIVKAVVDAPAFTFDKLNIEKWLLVNAGIDMLPPVHIVDRYMETVAPLGVENDGEGLDYFLPSGTGADLTLPVAFTAFVIGAKHNTKKMPLEKIVAVCRRIIGQVVLLGGPEDAGEGARIAEAAGTHVLNLCGKLSLHESAYALNMSQRVITHDTGLMHIAAAFGKEILSVWGNTVPEFGMTPYYGNRVVKNTIAEVKNLYCRPCSKIGFDKCPLGHFRCMTEQDEHAIAGFGT